MQGAEGIVLIRGDGDPSRETFGPRGRQFGGIGASRGRIGCLAAPAFIKIPQIPENSVVLERLMVLSVRKPL
jgi:hypothetical protein